MEVRFSVEGRKIGCADNWKIELFYFNPNDLNFLIGIYRNDDVNINNYQVWKDEAHCDLYFNSLNKAIKEVIKCLKPIVNNNKKVIPTIMRLTSLLNKENK